MSDEEEEEAGSDGKRPPKSDEKNNDAKRRVLARRATFIAAALAGVSTACGKEPATNPPCLTPIQPTQQEAGPEPCLSAIPVYAPPPDAGAASASTEPPQDAGPKPTPQPCLKVAPTRETK